MYTLKFFYVIRVDVHQVIGSLFDWTMDSKRVTQIWQIFKIGSESFHSIAGCIYTVNILASKPLSKIKFQIDFISVFDVRISNFFFKIASNPRGVDLVEFDWPLKSTLLFGAEVA